MPVSPNLQAVLERRHAKKAKAAQEASNLVKHGAEIFEGTDYPQDWSGFVGQAGAVEHLRAHLASVEDRGAGRLDHILLASGLHGIGKTTLAMLVAAKARTVVTPYDSTPGFLEISGPVTVDEARERLLLMEDGDIVFWDEIHRAVGTSRNGGDWMLPLLTDGHLLTARGREEMPRVSFIGATTDAGKLPETFTSRFMVRPTLVPYTLEEGVGLVENLAGRMGVDVDPMHYEDIARAASCNPRDMRSILTAVRDLPDAPTLDLDKALAWSGFTRDGLTTVAVDMLQALLGSADHTASIDTIQGQLGEPGTLRHHEKSLLQRGYVSISPRGRVLTDEGVDRAIQSVQERA